MSQGALNSLNSPQGLAVWDRGQVLLDSLWGQEVVDTAVLVAWMDKGRGLGAMEEVEPQNQAHHLHSVNDQEKGHH